MPKVISTQNMDIDRPKLTTIGSRIAWLREQRSMSAAELCRATKTSTHKAIAQPSLWAIETGKTQTLKADTLFRIAAALGANPDWIRTGLGDPFLATPGTDEEAMGLYASLPDEKKAMILAAIKAIS